MSGLPTEIPHFSYSFLEGPREPKEISLPIREGNCRLFLQIFIAQHFGMLFSPNELLNPAAFEQTGIFIRSEGADREAFFKGLQTGDVIYAEKVAGKNGERLDFSLGAFDNRADYLTRLHSAIFVSGREASSLALSAQIPRVDHNQENPAIIHATAIQGSTELWSLATFETYYKPIAAKRFVS